MAEPTHWDDIQKLKVKREAGMGYTPTADLLKIIDKVASADVREAFVKTDVYEIRVKKW